MITNQNAFKVCIRYRLEHHITYSLKCCLKGCLILGLIVLLSSLAGCTGTMSNSATVNNINSSGTVPEGMEERDRTDSMEKLADPPNNKGRVGNIPTHPSFVTMQELNAVLAGSPQKSSVADSIPSNSKIVSMVVPHHLTAGKLIINAVAELTRQQPERIIVIGPNHFNKGSKIITGAYGWMTPNGILKADEVVVQRLVDRGIASRDDGVLAKEHSVGALVPIIYHFLPETEIVPIVLHHDVSLQQVDNLLNVLENCIDEKTVVISSVDFSHYLTRSEAQAKDVETLKYMRNFDYTTLYRLGNDYLDSPASLSGAFRLAEKQGIRTFTVLDNTNSGIILQNDHIETTSYFTIIFTK